MKQRDLSEGNAILPTKSTVLYQELTITWDEIKEIIDQKIKRDHPEFNGKPYCFNLGYRKDRLYARGPDHLSSVTFRIGERPDDHREFVGIKTKRETW